jgi:hypothetical protein
MDDLIQALQIFRQYANERNPTHCEHDTLYIMGVGEVSYEHAAELTRLGFLWDETEEVWYSFRFGSA